MFPLKFQPPFLFFRPKKKKKEILYKPFVCGETLVKKKTKATYRKYTFVSSVTR